VPVAPGGVLQGRRAATAGGCGWNCPGPDRFRGLCRRDPWSRFPDMDATRWGGGHARGIADLPAPPRGGRPRL